MDLITSCRDRLTNKMSSVKVRLLMALESFLRVPPLLIVDEIFRISFGVGNSANKYYQAGGILSGPHPRTTFIPDRSLETPEVLEVEEYTNETASSATSATIPSLQAAAEPADPLEMVPKFPVIQEIWQVLLDAVYEVFKAGSQTADATTSSATSSVSTSTIVEDVSSITSSVTASHVDPVVVEFSTAKAAADLIKFAEVLLCIVLFFVAIITFMLATENLIKLYSHLVSFLALYLSYIFTPFPTGLGIGTVPAFLYNLFCRSVIAGLYYACRSWPGATGGFNLSGTNDGDGGGGNDGGRRGTRETDSNNNTNSFLNSVTECLLLGMFFVNGAIQIHPLLYIIIMLGLHHPLLRCLPDIYAFLKSSWNETKRVQNEYGLSHLIQVESGRLRVNTVFRLFWITRAGYDAISKCCNEPLNSMVKYVMTHGTETFTGVVGLTVTVSAICHHIGECLLYLLYNGANTEADANRFGSISTVLFFILSLQTGLTSLDPEKRLDRLAKNIVLLGTALFHALHQMIAPVLTAFRAFQTLQIRAALLSCSSFMLSGFLTYYLLRHSTISTWSLAVLALAIEFKIKICISLLISFVVYLSQLVQYPEVLEKFVNACRRVLPTFVVRFFDHLHDELSHEDVVFYLRSFANVGEFLTGIFLFANAVWIFFFESASAIRAIGMSVHAYFNIWCEAQKGWRVYCQRKTASQKIMSLADASEDQLRARQDDVCAVCYEEMESAKVTNCNHLFHAVCLRKWLYVQNTCPLCHEVLYREDALENNENDLNSQLQAAAHEQQQRQNEMTEIHNASVPASPSAASHVEPVAHASRFVNNVPTRNVSATCDTNPFEVSNPSSDENDGDVDFPLNTNANDGDSSRRSSTRLSNSSSHLSNRPLLPSTSSQRFANLGHPNQSEHGNSSSGTDFTVDDGSDEEELWGEEFSTSEDDDDSRPTRNRGNAIGVPLLL